MHSRAIFNKKITQPRTTLENEGVIIRNFHTTKLKPFHYSRPKAQVDLNNENEESKFKN